MLRLSKLSLVVVSLFVVGAVALAVRYFADSPMKSAPGNMKAFLQAIPADTAFVMVGQNTPENLQEMQAWWEGGLADLRSNIEQITTHADQDHAGVRLLHWLVEDYITTTEREGLAGSFHRYGLDPEGVSAYYLHGAMPVARLGVSDKSQVLAFLEQAEAEAGVAHRVVTLGEAKLHAWPLTNSPDLPQLELGILVTDDSITLSLLTERDEDATRRQRFALSPPRESLANTDALSSWRDKFERSDLMLGFIDFQRMVEAVLLPERNSMGRELALLFPDYQGQLPQLTPACRQEYVDLAGIAPRVILGLTNYDLEGEQLILGLRSIVEIKHADIASQLQRLPGFLPSYSFQLDDKIFAYALGLDTESLMPVLTDLWTKLIQANFECEQLQSLQQMAASYNPMMLGLGMGMVQGLKGIGLAVYELEPDPESIAGMTGQAIISVSTKNPQAVAALLTTFIPGMHGLVFPEDGTPVALPPFFVPAGTHAAIKGDHLVIYRGVAAQEAAEALAEEPLHSNGVSAFVLNVTHISDQLLDHPEAFADYAQGQCATAWAGVLEMQQGALAAAYSTTFNELGWDGKFKWHAAKPAGFPEDFSGTYLLELVSEDCAWESLGLERKRPDGTGSYTLMDQELGCSLYETEYNWSRSGSLLQQNIVSERERDACDDEWRDVTPEDFTCTLLPRKTGGFYCYQLSEGEAKVYRLMPQE